MLLYFGVVNLRLVTVKRRRTANNDKMAGACLLAFVAGFLLKVNGLAAEENSGKPQRSGNELRRKPKVRGVKIYCMKKLVVSQLTIRSGQNLTGQQSKINV